MIKSTLLFVFSLLVSLSCLAQVDPATTNRNLLPAPLTAVGEIFSMTFVVGNFGTSTITGATAATRMQFSVTLQDCLPNPASTAAVTNLSASSGTAPTFTSFADYFDITYDPALNAFNYLQKLDTPLPGGVLRRLVISAKVTKYSTSTAINTIGATCHVANMTGEANTSNNQTVIFTHTTVTASMPVSLVSFTAQAQADRTALLKWSTSWERNNKGYVIERSKDLLNFESVGEVNDVAGSSNSISTYRFVDQSPYRGTSYYRLRQVDLDGSSQTFKAEPVVIDGRYGVYPNPVVSNEFTLELDEPSRAVLHLYGVNGSELGVSKSALTEISAKVSTPSKLSSGIYLLTVEERGSIRQHRIVVP